MKRKYFLGFLLNSFGFIPHCYTLRFLQITKNLHVYKKGLKKYDPTDIKNIQVAYATQANITLSINTTLCKIVTVV